MQLLVSVALDVVDKYEDERDGDGDEELVGDDGVGEEEYEEGDDDTALDGKEFNEYVAPSLLTCCFIFKAVSFSSLRAAF